jgi:hypothetical protein
MKEVTFRCRECGTLIWTFDDTKSSNTLCIACRRKHGLLNQESERLRKELERLQEGKELNSNQKKDLLLELAVSEALKELKIPHDPNPFDVTYPCYQEDRPDIIIERLDTVIECKNLNEKQVIHLNKKWLDENIIERPNVASYKCKRVVFSYGLRCSLKEHLENHGWKAYSLGTQILTLKEAYEAIPKLKQRFAWLASRLAGKQKLLTLYCQKQK